MDKDEVADAAVFVVCVLSFLLAMWLLLKGLI